LQELYEVVKDRVEKKPPGSYTALLASSGLGAVLKKVGEEATEVVVAASLGSKKELVEEVADLLYHLIVLLAFKEVTLSEVIEELKRRRGSCGRG